MSKWVKYRILIILFAGFTFGFYAQTGQNGPPPPITAASPGNGKGPCGALESANPGGPRIPPPVGLCLPINDYLLPLLLVGIAFGGYKVWKFETPSNAV